MEINRNILYTLYIVEKKTTVEIANIFKKSSTTISNKLKKYNIPVRNSKEAQVKRIKIEKYVLYDLYINQNKSLKEISKIYNCNEESIRRLCIYYGIERRNKTANFGGHNKGVPMDEYQKINLSKKRQEYYKFNVHWNKGNHWNNSTRKKISLGLLKVRTPAPSFYGKDWIINRTSCLQRDEYICQQCGSQEKIEVHHWIPYRFSYDNSLDNLVSLCRFCHKDIHKKYIYEKFIEEAERDFYYAEI